MASMVLSGDTSGAITVTVPAVAGTNTITLPAATGTVVIAGQNSAITSGTAVASTSGTSIDFTGIPSWVKRITVMLNGVSTNGTGGVGFRLGTASGPEATGYVSGSTKTAASTLAASAYNTVFFISSTNTPFTINGSIVFTLLNSTTNTWVANGTFGDTNALSNYFIGGSKSLSASLTQVRILTGNFTDTFNAGSINILYE